MQGNELRKKKVSTKKTSKILKKSSPRASDTGKGSYKHNAPDLWDRGSITTTMCDGVLHCLWFVFNVFLVALHGD